jgi:Transglutaminase-like superfamily
MKRGLILLVVLFAGLGTFLYSTNSDFKAEFNSWLGIAQQDSVQENSQADTVLNTTHSTGKISKRKKIPKTIKPDKYAHLDKYARETPDKYSRSNSELAKYLKRPAKNDLEKARLIYSWIATHIHYDDEGFNTGQYKDEIADSVVVRRKAVCEGFSSLFQELGLLMDLEVEKISGYAKGYGYKPGDKFLDTDHAWNAVKIDGIWKLVDVTWGSSEGETTEKGLLKSTMRFDSYWFCVPPEAFIFSHLPENKDWQLTSQAVTLKQYENLPFLHISFFKLGFNAEDIFLKAISGNTKEFVETFPFDYPVNGGELPIIKELERGREYTFSIESEYLESVMIVDGGPWTELKREGNVFKIKYTPTGDKLEIFVKANWYDKEFWTIAVYEVVAPKNLTAHNKMLLQ